MKAMRPLADDGSHYDNRGYVSDEDNQRIAHDEKVSTLDMVWHCREISCCTANIWLQDWRALIKIVRKQRSN